MCFAAYCENTRFAVVVTASVAQKGGACDFEPPKMSARYHHSPPDREGPPFYLPRRTLSPHTVYRAQCTALYCNSQDTAHTHSQSHSGSGATGLVDLNICARSCYYTRTIEKREECSTSDSSTAESSAATTLQLVAGILRALRNRHVKKPTHHFVPQAPRNGAWLCSAMGRT